MENFDKEFQAEVVDEYIANGHKEVPDNLCPTTQCRARKTDMSRHPKAREEGDGELENESCYVRREGHETKVENLTFEDEVIEHIIQHPLQHQVHAATSRIAEQLEGHHLVEWRIEKVDDRGQGAFYPGFYVFHG